MFQLSYIKVNLKYSFLADYVFISYKIGIIEFYRKSKKKEENKQNKLQEEENIRFTE